MLHLFRQHRLPFAALLVPALLLVWMSFSCQNCFADTMQTSTQKIHAAMDCCPPNAHQQHEQHDSQACDHNYLLKQPMLTDGASVQLPVFANLEWTIAELLFTDIEPVLIRSSQFDNPPDYYSDRLFSSYRILLI